MTKPRQFYVPSIVDRSPVMVAVSTGGASPVLARQLRMRLETMISSQCGELAGITEEYRDIVKQRLAEPLRKSFWEQALKGRLRNWCMQVMCKMRGVI